jgi:hypothetical protein
VLPTTLHSKAVLEPYLAFFLARDAYDRLCDSVLLASAGASAMSIDNEEVSVELWCTADARIRTVFPRLFLVLESFVDVVRCVQEASDLPQEIGRLLHTRSSPDQLYTWLIPTDDVVDAVKSSRDALESSVEDRSLVRCDTSAQQANDLFNR